MAQAPERLPDIKAAGAQWDSQETRQANRGDLCAAGTACKVNHLG
jgi:hypothetical protein